MNVRPWLPPLLWAGVIIFATSMPSGFVPQQVTHVDKAAHYTMYAVFAALLTWRLREGRSGTSSCMDVGMSNTQATR